MSSMDIFRWVCCETWWTWNRPVREPYLFQDFACHYFNLFEATSWFVFAGLVISRWSVNRKSSLEIAYATAFVLFGVSDVIEAWTLTSWLLWWKLVNLIVLYLLRRTVMRRYYPDRRLF